MMISIFGVELVNNFFNEQSFILFFLRGFLIRRNCKKVQLAFIFCPISNSILSKATGLISSYKVSVNLFLLKMDFFVILIYCMFNQSFYCPFDGNSRSETAPVVNICATLRYLLFKRFLFEPFGFSVQLLIGYILFTYSSDAAERSVDRVTLNVHVFLFRLFDRSGFGGKGLINIFYFFRN